MQRTDDHEGPPPAPPEPELLRVTSDEANAQRDRFLATTKLALAFLVLAGAGGIDLVEVGSLQLMAAASAVAFFSAAFLTAFAQQARLQVRWEETRALAEQLRSLSWLYVMRAGPFGADDAVADQAYVDEQVAAVESHPNASPAAVPDGRSIRTATLLPADLRRLRQAELDVRRRAYLAHRVVDQQAYFAGRARSYELLAQRLRIGSLVAQLAGGIVMVLVAFSVLDVDLSGVLTATASALLAYAGVRNFDRLGDQYRRQAVALLGLQHRLERSGGDGSEVARLVADVEAALAQDVLSWREALRATS